jgi:hypothetical protein
MERVEGDRLDQIAPSLSKQDAFKLAASVGTALAAMAIAATTVATAAPSRAACDDGTPGAEQCLADCPM